MPRLGLEQGLNLSPDMQGMGTALQRIGQNPEGTVGSGVSNDDPDLVAYWTFDEGRGYVVHDVTQRGHDLYLTSEPHWEASSARAVTNLMCHGRTLQWMAWRMRMIAFGCTWTCV